MESDCWFFLFASVSLMIFGKNLHALPAEKCLARNAPHEGAASIFLDGHLTICVGARLGEQANPFNAIYYY